MKKVFMAAFMLLSFLGMISCNNNSQTMNAKKYTDREVIETILSRKSVRTYLDKPVEEAKIELLLRAGMAAPSGKDVRPWHFVVIRERAVLDSMAAGLPYAKMLTHAPMAIVVCGDVEQQSYWYLDCSTAAENILLAAEALGLGAVWTAAYPYEERMKAVAQAINLPDNIHALTVIPVGYPKGDYRSKEKYDSSRIHYNRW